MQLSKHKNLIHILAVNLFVIVLLIFTPSYSYDSFLIPKFVLLVLFGMSGFLYLLFNFKRISAGVNKQIKIFTLGFLVIFLISFLFSESPKSQLIYGVESRGNGLLTYLSLIIVFIVFGEMSLETIQPSLIRKFAIASSFVVMYSWIQIFGLDPFKWDAKTINNFSTLGNPNFLSAFIAIAVIPVITALLRITPKFGRFVSIIAVITVFLIFFILIYRTFSLQGFIVLGVSIISWLMIWSSKNKRVFLNLSILIASFPILIFTILGSLNHGPFANLLYKSSIESRGDFFRSGIEIGKAHIFTGVGADSFPDYYLQYRDSTAANRLNPEATNSAHNYLLDIFANFGIFALLLYISLFLITFYSFIKFFRLNEFNQYSTALFTVWLGCHVQSLVSPTNLVFNILIFSISGLVIGLNKNGLISTNDSHPSMLKRKYVSVSIILGVSLGLIVTSPLVRRDHAILVALNGDSAEKVISAMNMFPKSSASYSRTMQILERSGLRRQSLEMARIANAFNPRSSAPYYIILISPFTTPEEKLNGYNNLIALDPNNLELRKLKP